MINIRGFATSVTTGCSIAFAICASQLVAHSQPQTLYLYNWAEYIPSELIDKFEAETGSTVVEDVYPDNESMVAKLQGGGVSQYDIVVPSTYVVPMMVELGLLQPLQKDLLPNFDNLDPQFLNASVDPDNDYTVPYQWGTIGIAYRADRIGDNFDKSWGVLFDPELQPGSFVLMDDQRPMISAAAIYLGFDPNTADPDELRQIQTLLTEAKQRSNGFIDGVGGKDQLVAGTSSLAIVFGGDALRAADENPDLDIGYFIPTEGGQKWLDSMAIPAQAPNADLAHQFINFILDAENGAELSNYTQFPTPNQAARDYIEPDDLANPAIYPPDDIEDQLYFEAVLDGSEMQLIDALWTNVKGK